MSVMLCTAPVSFDITGIHLHTFRILELYPSKDIELDLSHVVSH